MDVEEYRKKLEDDNISYVDLGIWLKKYRPKFLYKYMGFDNKNYWKNNTIGGQAFFQRLDYLNDPFDCLTYFDKEKLIDKLFHDVDESLDKKILREGFFERIRENGISLEDMFNQFRKTTRVFCMSQVNDSVLMWTHYAANHRGICIEYDVEKMKWDFQRAIFPVIYTNHRYDSTNTIVQIVCERECKKNTILNPLFYKAKQWEYEKEWRYVADELSFFDKKYIVDLSNCISAIYFGQACDLEEKNIAGLLSWTEEKKIFRYQMCIEAKSYRLIPVQF